MSKNSFFNKPIFEDAPAKNKKKGSLRLWLVLIVLFILGGISALVEKIKASSHPALFTMLIIGIVAVGVCVFLTLRYSKKKRESAVDSVEIPSRPAPAPKPAEKYEFYPVKTVGVTFNNGDGTSRQELIEKMYYKEPPFDVKELQLELEPYEYKNEPAFKVVVNGCQIGNLSRHDARYAVKNMDRFVDLCGAEIVGGDVPKDDDYDFGDNDEDENYDYEYNHKYDYNEPLPWGFHFIIKYSK